MIVWKDGSVGRGTVQLSEKITSKEWKTYRKRIIEINGITDGDRVKTRLKETWRKIKLNGGFC